MPQGYENSSAIFQRGMSIILESIIGVDSLTYIDDILVFGESKETHKKNLEIVKERLNLYDLKINKSKSIFEHLRVDFLRYSISENKIEPLTRRSESITNYIKPNTKKQFMRFLGYLNYDRLFIPNLSAKLNPLYKLLKTKCVKLVWSEDTEIIFKDIKEI
ncbi:Transposon Ty3-I Gag-Pol polyprotein [Dictyocoela muelleri]|nr:Transposon Ty3-I Gag-Pol polyprotein [Dictyocoela muelleri]